MGSDARFELRTGEGGSQSANPNLSCFGLSAVWSVSGSPNWKPPKTLGFAMPMALGWGQKENLNRRGHGFGLIADWLPGRNLASTIAVKSAWEVTPYYTRAYEKGCLFVRGDKPQELASIAKITARQWHQYQNGRHRENPAG